MAVKKQSFENQLVELEGISDKMSKGDLPLEEALKEYEHGLKLAFQCQKSLTQAEQKIERLVSENDELFATLADDAEEEA